MPPIVPMLNGSNLNLLGTREPFRHHSFVSPLAKAAPSGCGSHGYHLAPEHFSHSLKGCA